nr:hypothetical protein [Deinococcus betulae]
MNAGDPSRASHVWRVETEAGPELWHRSWWTAPEVSAFMLGLGRLFGVDPRDLKATAEAYTFWRHLDVWAVPAVADLTDFQGRPTLRVEFMAGDISSEKLRNVLRNFSDRREKERIRISGKWRNIRRPPGCCGNGRNPYDTGDLAQADARELGRRVAAVHAHPQLHFGDVTGTHRFPLAEFYPRALAMIQAVAPRYRFQDWAAHEATVTAIFQAAPVPSAAVPMLLDWNGSQFVWREGQPFALVDVEASALAPPELDLCFWEVLLDGAQAQAFEAGYREMQPFPDLSAHRAACRLILLTLEVEGAPPLGEWLALPTHFTSPT